MSLALHSRFGIGAGARGRARGFKRRRSSGFGTGFNAGWDFNFRG
jgi:hypothetical protein